jgi:hypothetical protein
MFKTVAFMPENGFLRAPHQITASAYLVRDDAGLRDLPFLWRFVLYQTRHKYSMKIKKFY